MSTLCINAHLFQLSLQGIYRYITLYTFANVQLAPSKEVVWLHKDRYALKLCCIVLFVNSKQTNLQHVARHLLSSTSPSLATYLINSKEQMLKSHAPIVHFKNTATGITGILLHAQLHFRRFVER